MQAEGAHQPAIANRPAMVMGNGLDQPMDAKSEPIRWLKDPEAWSCRTQMGAHDSPMNDYWEKTPSWDAAQAVSRGLART